MISPYLFDASQLADPETVVYEEANPPTGWPRMITGTQPIDFEQYVLDDEQKEQLLSIEPAAKKFIRPYLSTDDFVNGETRWILALQKATATELKEMPEIRRRMQIVSQKRAESKRVQTKKLADYPTSYNVTVIPEGQFLVIPEVSSEKRVYIPIAWLEPPAIPSNKLRIFENASPYLFGMLTSRMHLAWVRYVSGRLKSDFQYSVGICYNPFPWPNVNGSEKRHITELAESVLAARQKHNSDTLAALYEADTMPPDLRKAHQALDTAVDKLYRKEPFQTDRERVEFLLCRYEKDRAPLVAAAKPIGKRRRRA